MKKPIYEHDSQLVEFKHQDDVLRGHYSQGWRLVTAVLLGGPAKISESVICFYFEREIKENEKI